jgi:modulator of FtsH protease HflK
MPWSNQSGPGGGGRKPPGGPWGQGPSGGGNGSGDGNRPSGSGGGSGPGGQPPDLEELLKRSKDSIRSVTQGNGPSGGMMFALAAALAAIIGFYAFTFRVNPDEYGVVLRFGKFDRGAEPGLHFKLPYPIEEVRKPTVPRQNTIEIGSRAGSSQRGFGTNTRGGGAVDSLMLTADENIVDVDFIVFWRIDPRGISDYLFTIANPENTVREVAESAMREIVGQTNIQPLLTDARQRTEQSVQRLMQATLDTYKAGVRIDQVQLRAVDPPQQVIAAFRDVQSARNERDRLVNEANTYFNRIVPEAKGEADRIRIQAEGYKAQTVAEATGQAARFKRVLEEYEKAPDVTRQRLYLETMERVFGGTDKIVIDGKTTGGGSGVVPFLPLDQLTRKKEGN